MANPTADFPTSLHNAVDITAFTSTPLGSSSTPHTQVHGKIEQELNALDAKVGTGSSTPTSGKVLYGNGVGTSVWSDLSTLVNALTPTFASVTINGATGNTLVVDTNTFVVDATNNRVGISTATPRQPLDLGSASGGMQTGDIIIDGVPASFSSSWPFVRNGTTPSAFMYIDNQYNLLRIGAQSPSNLNAIAFELPHNSEYQDVMALSPTSLVPAAALTNQIDLGVSTNKWKSIYLGTGASVIGGSIAFNPVSKTSNYTLTDADSVIWADATSGVITMTLPTAVGINGRVYTIKRINSGANNVTIATTSSQTIDGLVTQVLGTQYQSYQVMSDGSNWNIL